MAKARTVQDKISVEFEESSASSREANLPDDFEGNLSQTDESSLSSCPEFEPRSRENPRSTVQEQAVENVLNLYRKMISFVEQDDFDFDLRKELNAAFKSEENVQILNPNIKASPYQQAGKKKHEQFEYLDVFEMRMEDLMRMECGLAVTGEVSSGKTSLINKLVGEMLVTPKHLAATSKIVRIINSGDLKFRACDIKKKDVKERSFEDVSKMRNKLDKYTNVRKRYKKLTNVHYIDVHCPFRRLQVKGNVMLVDTPGIGESADLTKMLLQYLPNAVAFIFLIDVSHAGGVQPDRLLRILETILQQKAYMPCFEPEDVLFVTNKWNYINEPLLPGEVIEGQDERDSDDNEDEEDTDQEDEDQKDNKTEKERVWDEIERKLKEVWPTLDMERVFKLNLQNVTENDDKEEERMEFQRFCEALSKVLDKNKNKRVRRHLSLLEDTTKLVEREILARIHTATCDDEGQVKMLQSTLARMKILKKRCEEISDNLHREIDIRVSRLTEKIFNRLHSPEGKENLLNPHGQKRIQKCILLGKEIPLRVKDGLIRWMRSEEVLNEIDEIEKKITEYFEEVNLQIDRAYVNITGDQEAKTEKTKVSTVIKYAVTAPIWLPLFVVAGALSLVAVVVLSPLFFVGLAVRNANMKKMEIDAYYNACLATISKNEIRDNLDSIFRRYFEERIKSIFGDQLPKEIGSSVCTITYIMLKRKDIRQNLEKFLRLQQGIYELRADVYCCLKEFNDR